MSKGTHDDRLMVAAADWVPAENGPPPGSVGNDPDGAMIYFGPDPVWLPIHEGQIPGVIPAPTTASRQDPACCETCGAALGADYRRMGGQTCAGCLVNERKDDGLNAEVVRDQVREDERKAREAAEKGPQDFASRLHRSAAREARSADTRPPHAPAGPAEPRPSGKGKGKGKGKARPR